MTEEDIDPEETEESIEDPPSLELLNLLPNPDEMPLEDYLKAMGVFCIQMHNHLHPVEIAKLAPLFVSSKFHVKASPEIYMIATSLKEYLSNVKYFRKTNPHYHVVSKNLSVDLNEELGEATLIATMETHGLLGASDNLVRQSVYMGHWRRRKHTGRWYAQRLEIIRGPGSEPTF
ncbi:hypothetical protein M409DRAFT_23994 [Zasmidium cellare ATCC 36951]|uniref:SnoaL-like domain-containing protein n=1 Tax=Zasmidium cellare ATCC 36951 TaxID=1080233 RepID=A0A6A6CER4_ZASCE|nr:uncharacterized protein M409DRAFT_23994 [Zasmidium cellare ATCC 36951]KAF2165704.1 hypothetical protein M409DRAFT_23994 [Zasmidium cellare ATCC 36951]